MVEQKEFYMWWAEQDLFTGEDEAEKAWSAAVEQTAKQYKEIEKQNAYLKCALDSISSGFADTKKELEHYAEQKLIDIEKGIYK